MCLPVRAKFEATAFAGASPPSAPAASDMTAAQQQVVESAKELFVTR